MFHTDTTFSKETKKAQDQTWFTARENGIGLTSKKDCKI